MAKFLPDSVVLESCIRVIMILLKASSTGSSHTCLFVYLFICLFVYLFVYLFIFVGDIDGTKFAGRLKITLSKNEDSIEKTRWAA